MSERRKKNQKDRLFENGCREVTPEVPSPINRSKMSGFRPVPKAEGAHCRESFDSDLRPICSCISFRQEPYLTTLSSIPNVLLERVFFRLGSRKFFFHSRSSYFLFQLVPGES